MNSPARAVAERRVRRIAFTGRQQVTLLDEPLAAPAAGEVVVRSLVSLMSIGTENICFNRLFEPGTGWDQWVTYPFLPGYSLLGVVEALGDGVATRRVGDLVALRYHHASRHLAPAEDCMPVPAGLDPHLAVWFGLAKIAAMGALAAEYAFGDEVAVIGAGPIGQMAVRWARALGCRSIIVIEPSQPRLALARAGGATATFAMPIDQALDEVIAANGGRAPRVVVDSTGNEKVFASALKLVARRGTMVLLGDTGSPSQQRLTSDLICRGLRVVGAHDTLNDERWNNATITRYFFELVQQGRFPLAGLTTHVIPAAEHARAYQLANERRGETMGIVFDWA